MIYRTALLTLIAITLTGCGGGPGVRSYERAKQAYERGDFKTAFAYNLYAANQNVGPAQYAVGYQYFYGIGVKMDQASAVKWFRAGAYHSPQARYALSLIKQSEPLEPWSIGLTNQK